MVSVLALGAVDRGFEPRSGKTENYAFEYSASVLSRQYYSERAKTRWLGIGIMCPNGATCLYPRTVVSVS
jgi:hypothetical protein